MTDTPFQSYFRQAILGILEETFDNVRGIYLDQGTSLFATLATISAEEASIPVSANCACIAAHVEHMNLYMEIILEMVQGNSLQVDWTEIWDTVKSVTPEEWESSQQKLRDTVERIRDLATNSTWENEGEIRGALGMIAHNAYHLGEIRQALCTLKS